MALDFTGLNSTITALTAQVTNTVGVEDSAEVLINGFAAAVTKAVTDALTASDVTNQATVQAVSDAITGVTTQFVASAGALGTAVAGTGPTPAPGPAPAQTFRK